MKRFDSPLAFLLFIAAFLLYVRTLAPSLLYGDSAEFQTIAYTLGIGHPTGYPIYVLLAKLFTFIPISEVAYRVNLFSAFCAALTVALVYLTIRKLGATYVAAIYGSLALALTPLFWKHSSLAEIYALSAACLTLILFSVLQWKETNNSRWIFLAGLFGGLSLGIHTTVALSGIAILLYLVLVTRQRADWLQASLGASVGVVIFLASFLFLDFLNSPAGYYNTAIYPSLSVWGMTNADFDSPFERLAFLYFPPQFKGQFFSVSSDEVKSRLTDFIEASSRNLWLVLLGFISLIIPRKDSSARWREAILLVLTLIMFLVFAATYNVFDFNVYYIPAIIILTIFVGIGVSAIIEMVRLIPNLPRVVPVVLSILILIAAFYPSMDDISLHWKERIPPGLENWESYYYRFPDQRLFEAEAIVNDIEDAAISDAWGSELYIQFDTRNNIIKNNIFHAKSGMPYVLSWSPVMTNNVMNYNLFYGGTTWQWRHVNYTTFSAYQSGTGNDANSLNNVNPSFVNPASGDLHLQLGSPAINVGQTISEAGSVDIDGQARVQGSFIDMGADEKQ